ncbi:hypothetical protein D9758_017074 [Tetrapyrgos nigripes]|uniref:MYND-type domain-containing protein n=1 Tax=Tetrapyrgos nigripes TaxID=182062 RepID=A0A8H5BHU1_9AGAR|nr:hypothetical protein D9758_017074 [Tetrapyrgos nigripes]
MPQHSSSQLSSASSGTSSSRFSRLPPGRGPHRTPSQTTDLTSNAEVEGSRSSPTPEQEKEHSLKRTLEALQQENAELKSGGKKKPLTNKTFGRPIKKVVDLFEPITAIVDERDRRAIESDEETDEELEIDEDELNDEEKEARIKKAILERDQDRLYGGFVLLCKHVHGFRKIIDEWTDPCALRGYYNELERGAKNARGEDIHEAKEKVADWLNMRSSPPSPLLDRTTRLGHGFTNHTTGLLLCPIEFNWNNSKIRDEIRSSVKSVVNDENLRLPFSIRCLYLDERAEVDKAEKGYLQGPLLINMYKLIFTSLTTDTHSSNKRIVVDSSDEEVDSTAAPEPAAKRLKVGRRSTKKTVAQLLDMKNVTPRTIAYSAVMLRFALSDALSWDSDQTFDYHAFYNSIVDYFEEALAKPGSEEERHIKKLLRWWDSKIFPKAGAASSGSKPLQDMKNTFAAQRALKASRKAARTAQAQTAASGNGSGDGSGDAPPAPSAASVRATYTTPDQAFKLNPELFNFGSRLTSFANSNSTALAKGKPKLPPIFHVTADNFIPTLLDSELEKIDNVVAQGMRKKCAEPSTRDRVLIVNPKEGKPNVNSTVWKNKNPRQCSFCEKVSKNKDLQKCSRCKLMFYRGKECQRMAWPSHKFFCKSVTQTA